MELTGLFKVALLTAISSGSSSEWSMTRERSSHFKLGGGGGGGGGD